MSRRELVRELARVQDESDRMRRALERAEQRAERYLAELESVRDELRRMNHATAADRAMPTPPEVAA